MLRRAGAKDEKQSPEHGTAAVRLLEGLTELSDYFWE
jgi:hypothetical protein